MAKKIKASKTKVTTSPVSLALTAAQISVLTEICCDTPAWGALGELLKDGEHVPEYLYEEFERLGVKIETTTKITLHPTR